MKFHRILSTSLCSILIVGAIGCTQNTSSQNAPPAQSGLPQSPSEPPAPPVDPLLGDWSSTCVDSSGFGLTESAHLRMQGNEVVLVTKRSLRESDCSLGDIEVTRIGQVLHQQASAERNERNELKIEWTAFRVKPISAIGLSALRIKRWCGIEKWVLDKEEEIVSRGRGEDRNCEAKLGEDQKILLRDDQLRFAPASESWEKILGRHQYFIRSPAPGPQ